MDMIRYMCDLDQNHDMGKGIPLHKYCLKGKHTFHLSSYKFVHKKLYLYLHNIQVDMKVNKSNFQIWISFEFMGIMQHSDGL